MFRSNARRISIKRRPYTNPSLTQMGTPFELKELYQRAVLFDLPHPHITLKCMREAGILSPQGDGMFRWNQ